MAEEYSIALVYALVALPTLFYLRRWLQPNKNNVSVLFPSPIVNAD